jgi:hypothetical protein
MSVTVTISTMVGEGIVRAVAPQQLISYRSDVYQPAETLRYTKRPNIRTTINSGERTVHLTTDREGLRVGRTGRGDAETSVLVLGDSFMEALQVEYEQSVPGLLESALPALIERSVAVRNAGVGGYAPNQYAVLARRLLGREHFAMVLIMVCLQNDVEPRHRIWAAQLPHMDHPLRVPNGLTSGELIDALAYPINDFLEQRSHLFTLARYGFRTALMRLHLSPLPLPTLYLKHRAMDPAWDSTVVILHEIGSMATARGVPVLYVLLPSSFQVDTAEWARYVRAFRVDTTDVDLNQPNRRIGGGLRGLGDSVIDATPTLAAAVRSGIQTHGRLDPHLTPEGHALVARLIEPSVGALIASGGRGATARGPYIVNMKR